jgi:hypothetical protein
MQLVRWDHFMGLRREIAERKQKPLFTLLSPQENKMRSRAMSVKTKNSYHRIASYRQSQKQKAARFYHANPNVKRFTNTLQRAKRNHWLPLVSALEKARIASGGANAVNLPSVYASVGLKWGAKTVATELWCEWKPNAQGRPKMSDAEKKERMAMRRQQPRFKEVERACARRKLAKRKGDPHWQVRMTVTRRICDAMRRYSASKSAHSEELCGCTWAELRHHLQSQFTGRMAWDNHGTHWHIDHIIPCAAFDLTDPQQQRQCFNWSNLQPLEAKANQSKGARYYAATVPLGL